MSKISETGVFHASVGRPGGGDGVAQNGAEKASDEHDTALLCIYGDIGV